MDPLFYGGPNVFFRAIHADWPTYPSGQGWQYALADLCNFPVSTTFYQIEDIDKCLLFSSIDPSILEKQNKDAYDEKQYQVAVWHEDLLNLHERGLVMGVTTISEYEYRLNKFEKFLSNFPSPKQDSDGNLMIPSVDGNYIIYHRPIDPSNEDYQEPKDVVMLADKTLRLTNAGLETARELTWTNFHHVLKRKVEPLLQIEYFDTAIREAVLQIEHELKIFHASEEYGQKLIDSHIASLKARNIYKASFLKVYRLELRTLVKFIRNEFMHNHIILDSKELYRLLGRINRVYLWMRMVTEQNDPE